MFWELTAKTGYFCHAAVGVPEREYPGLKASVAPIFRDFVTLVGQSLVEFKHTEFKRLDYRHQRKLALRLRDALTAHGAFIAGFYTPARAFVFERVRVGLMDEAEEIPEDGDPRYDQAAGELRAELQQGPGQSGVIWRLLLKPVMGVGNLLASLDCSYRIVCDPRDKREDKAVRAMLEDIVARTGNLRGIPEAGDMRTDLDLHSRGIDFSRTSEHEVGLQIADLNGGPGARVLQGQR